MLAQQEGRLDVNGIKSEPIKPVVMLCINNIQVCCQWITAEIMGQWRKREESAVFNCNCLFKCSNWDNNALDNRNIDNVFIVTIHGYTRHHLKLG